MDHWGNISKNIEFCFSQSVNKLRTTVFSENIEIPIKGKVAFYDHKYFFLITAVQNTVKGFILSICFRLNDFSSFYVLMMA